MEELIVETFWQDGEASPEALRVRPISGQSYSVNVRVSCSRSSRYDFPSGTLLRISVTPVNRIDGGFFLRGNIEKAEIVSREDAQEFIRQHFGRSP